MGSTFEAALRPAPQATKAEPKLKGFSGMASLSSRVSELAQVSKTAWVGMGVRKEGPGHSQGVCCFPLPALKHCL